MGPVGALSSLMFLAVPTAHAPASRSTRTGQQSASLTFEAPKSRRSWTGRGEGRGELVKAASEPGATMGGQHRASQAGLWEGCLLVVFRRCSTGNWLIYFPHFPPNPFQSPLEPQ